MPEFTGHRDLRAYIRILWRWKLLFLAFVVAVPIAAYLVERGKPNIYESSALVGINNATVNTALLGGGGSFSTSNVTAIAELVTTSPVARVAASLLHPPADPSTITGEVSASGDITTNFLTITAQDRSPARAAEIANAFAKAISLNRQDVAIGELHNAIVGIKAQLRHLSRTDTATRPSLEQQLSQLRAARSTQGSEAALLQPATPNPSPVGPHLRRAVELALLIGVLLGLGAVLLAENADRRLRTPDDLEGMTELPMLAAIAPSAFSGKLETSPGDDEAFQMLRTALMYFNVSRRLTSVMITSAGEKEGKTTIATRLALNLAHAGHRVLLVDADLRRAQVGPRFGIEAKAGFGAVLAGAWMLPTVLVNVPLEDPAEGSLTVLPAGPPPPNPAALLSSPDLARVLKELEAAADIVIIDTPAALAVSDPIPLMGLVSGVVLVARMNRSSRETTGRLRRMIESAGGTLVGVVATGVTSGQGYDYSAKMYSPNGSHRGLRRRPKPDAVPPPAANEPESVFAGSPAEPDKSVDAG
jgi:receptor protein-tyrosine kinase/non-specific protein-tyrosine kinase